MGAMAGEFKFGAVLSWEDFKFEDGGESDKLLIVLGARKGVNAIAVVCTSKQRSKKALAGCHEQEGYYFIPGGGRNWFKLDTWVELHRSFELDAAKLLTALMTKQATALANLSPEIAAAIRNCLKKTDDVTPAQIALLD